MRLLIKIAGVDEETLRLCPSHDWENVRAVGEIMICTWIYQTALFSLMGHMLFASPGEIRPEIVLVSAFIATFILFIDSYMIMRSGWHLNGISALKRGGLDISGGPAARTKAGLFLACRIMLSVGLAQFTALSVSELFCASDINYQIEKKYLEANRHLVGPATTLVDGEIQRATESVMTQSARVAALSRQVEALRSAEIDPSANDPQVQQAQHELQQLIDRKATADEDVRNAEASVSNELGGLKGAAPGRGPRYRAAVEQLTNARARAQEITKQLNAARDRLDALRKKVPPPDEKSRQQLREQLLVFEKNLDAENGKLTTLKDELAILTHGREGAIRRAIENAPDHVDLENGFLARMSVLEHIAQEDTKIAVAIGLIDFISFGFELAAVLAKVTSYVPTTYSALIARDAYMRAVRIVDGMTAELKPQVGAGRQVPVAGNPATRRTSRQQTKLWLSL